MPIRSYAPNALVILALAAALWPAQIACGQAETAPSKPAAAPAKADLYDETADARQQIAAALVKAGRENRRVLIQWGFENCSWCHLLHNLCSTNPPLKKKLSYEYDVVFIDIGDFDKNMDLAASYGADVKSGAPFLTILDAAGKPVANQETGSLETPKGTPAGHDPAKVLKFLTDHQAPYLSAEEVLSKGLELASAERKTVFLHFGAPWCGWCHRLEDWMAREDIAPILARSFVPLKIDQDRMIGAAKMLDRFNPAGGGIPWTAFLAPDGTALITSNGPDGNIGFPAADEEVAWFAEMLRKVGVPGPDADALIESLKAKP